MINRRNFLRTSALAGGVASLCASSPAPAQDGAPKSSEGGGYLYRRPKFKPGSRLLFQGDSITDMKWGRNEQDRNHYLGHRRPASC